MKTLTTLAALLLLASCTKDNERRVTVRAGGERFRVEMTGAASVSAEANLNWSTTLALKPGETIAISACRLPSDYIETPDTTYWTDTLNVALGVTVYLDGNPLADAGATTTNGSPTDACATLTYTVPER